MESFATRNVRSSRGMAFSRGRSGEEYEPRAFQQGDGRPPVPVTYGKGTTLAGVVVDPIHQTLPPTGTVTVTLRDVNNKVWLARTVEVGTNGQFLLELDGQDLPASPAPYTVTYE